MKSLIAGIIGAIASSAGWVAIEQGTQTEMGWMPLLVGLITGAGVRMGADAGSGESFGRGAMAAVLALAATLAGPYMKITYLKNVDLELPKPAQVEEPVEEADSEESDDSDAADAEREPLEFRGPSRGPSVGIKQPTKDMFSDWQSILWMCGSALLAYVAGKGGGGGTAPQATEETEPEEEQNQE